MTHRIAPRRSCVPTRLSSRVGTCPSDRSPRGTPPDEGTPAARRGREATGQAGGPMAGLPKEDAGHPVGTTVLLREEIAVGERSGSTHTRRWPAIRFVSLVAGLVSLTAAA